MAEEGLKMIVQSSEFPLQKDDLQAPQQGFSYHVCG